MLEHFQISYRYGQITSLSRGITPSCLSLYQLSDTCVAILCRLVYSTRGQPGRACSGYERGHLFIRSATMTFGEKITSTSRTPLLCSRSSRLICYQIEIRTPCSTPQKVMYNKKWPQKMTKTEIRRMPNSITQY